MVIRTSSAKQVDALIAQLRDGSPVQREAAIARLRVIGGRALDRLAALARSDAPNVARAAALKAIEGMNDPRARDVALALVNDGSAAIATAAVAAARPWLAADAAVLDAITALALDKTRPAPVRLAALDALAELPRAVIQPVLQQVGGDATLVSQVRGDRRASPFDQPAGVRDWLAKRGGTAPLSEIHDVIARIRERERGELSARRRQEWQVARAAAHLSLAHRNSRVALYDLRETFDAATTPLPLDLLTAVALVGDASCLEPMARAWAAAGNELWWRDRLAESARAIAAREKLTSRNAIVRRIRTRHPGFLR